MHFQVFNFINTISIYSTSIFDKSISNINISNKIISNTNIFDATISDASIPNTSIRKKMQMYFQILNYTNTTNILAIYRLTSD